MPPQARVPPADHPVSIWPTPEKQDLLFYVERDGRLPKYADWAYGDAYQDTVAYPDHKLIHVSPEDGKNWSRWYYAAGRINEDAYNWEYRQADLGGRKFDGVRRTYLVPRADFSGSTPAAGAAMPNVPAGLFSGYILATREQQRTGDAIFDSIYVIEVRDYVVRVTITSQKLDPAFGSPLATSETLYYRGEIYTGVTPIETAALSSAFWGLSALGVNTEVERLTSHWYLVTSQDVIPQGLASGTYGYLLRDYETWQDFSWPAMINAASLNFTSIERKNGSSTTTVRIKPAREAYNGPTRFRIEMYWSKTAQTSLTSPIVFDVQSKSYSGAQYSVSFSNVLVGTGGIALTDTIGTQDPVFEQAVYGDATWALASAQADWPDTSGGPAVFAISQAPYRGGFLTTVTSAWRPV